MEVCDSTSKDAAFKRTLVDEEVFQFTTKLLNKAASQSVIAPLLVTSNIFGELMVDLDSAGPSISAAPESIVKKTRMPPIVVSAKSVSNELIKKF